MRVRRQRNEIETHTPAKVNFFLELLGRRADGFHQLATVISAVSIYDSLRVAPRDDDSIRLTIETCESAKSDDVIPTDESNLIVKAFQLVRSRIAEQSSSELPGVNVHCVKRIPSQAGLGGASGNAAGALQLANEFWEGGLGTETLHDLAAQLGSDVPFFLTGGTALCEGRGEIITPLNLRRPLWLVVAKPPVGLSTGKVFKHSRISDNPLSCQRLSQSLSTGRIKKISDNLFNRLQSVASDLTSWIDRLGAEFSRMNCLGHLMSGSGSSYFGVFPNRISAIRAGACLSNRLPDAKIFTCQTVRSVAFEALN